MTLIITIISLFLMIFGGSLALDNAQYSDIFIKIAGSRINVNINWINNVFIYDQIKWII